MILTFVIEFVTCSIVGHLLLFPYWRRRDTQPSCLDLLQQSWHFLRESPLNNSQEKPDNVSETKIIMVVSGEISHFTGRGRINGQKFRVKFCVSIYGINKRSVMTKTILFFSVNTRFHFRSYQRRNVRRDEPKIAKFQYCLRTGPCRRPSML